MRKNRVLSVAALALAVVAGGGWTAQAEPAPEGKPAGHGKIHGYEVVHLPNEEVPNFERRTVWCPKGKKVLGGGAEAQPEGAELAGSFPTRNHRGWVGAGQQDDTDTVGISVYAICAYPR